MSRNVLTSSSVAPWSLGRIRIWPCSERTNSRLLPSPAWVIATGRRGLYLGYAFTAISGSGEVSTPSAALVGAAGKSEAASRPMANVRKNLMGGESGIEGGRRTGDAGQV